ncbi:MAG: glutaredoxin family protein [Mailhella sp.]|nr:glutaredoxin family protein [Mailhella sp.]
MDIIIAAAAALALAVIVFLIMKSGKKNAEAPAEKEERKPSNSPELYNLGMNPISDKPIMYALTTCLHCKNTRKFLEENGITPTVIYLDDFSGDQRSSLMEKVRAYNPRGTFPVVLIPGGKVIVGFRKQLLQEALLDGTGRTA